MFRTIDRILERIAARYRIAPFAPALFLLIGLACWALMVFAPLHPAAWLAFLTP